MQMHTIEMKRMCTRFAKEEYKKGNKMPRGSRGGGLKVNIQEARN